MPDIAMCTGDGCPQRQGCYRHIATPSEYRQAYFGERPQRVKLGVFQSCGYFDPEFPSDLTHANSNSFTSRADDCNQPSGDCEGSRCLP